MIVGGYTLDLYCDNEHVKHPYGEDSDSFAGSTFSQCARFARAKGWIINRRRRKAICPYCSGKRNLSQPASSGR